MEGLWVQAVAVPTPHSSRELRTWSGNPCTPGPARGFLLAFAPEVTGRSSSLASAHSFHTWLPAPWTGRQELSSEGLRSGGRVLADSLAFHLWFHLHLL